MKNIKNGKTRLFEAEYFSIIKKYPKTLYLRIKQMLDFMLFKTIYCKMLWEPKNVFVKILLFKNKTKDKTSNKFEQVLLYWGNKKVI